MAGLLRRAGTTVIATVVEARTRDVVAGIARAAAEGADAVEVRLDAVPGGLAPEAIAGELAAPVPLLAACRAKRDGGGFEGTEQERVHLLARAARTGCFLLDVERGGAAERLQAESADRIAVVSVHDPGGTPGDLAGRARDLLSSLLPGQIAKIVPTARTLSDALAVRTLLERARDPRLAAFAMGEPGRVSRILCGAWGSAAVWAAARQERPGAPGQIDLALLLTLFRFRGLTSSTKVYGVAGSPVAGSLSPAMHNAAYAWLGLDAVYVPLECVSAEDLAAFARALPLAGASITAPLKMAILPFLRRRDRVVEDAGACNTLTGEADGYNTDAEAALEEIRARLDPAGRIVIVLGGGGAARAVAFALREAGAKVTIAGRGPAGRAEEERGAATPAPDPRGPAHAPAHERARRLARDLGVRYVPIDVLEPDEDAILVNATSAPADAQVLPPHALRAAFLLDLRYAPRGGAPLALLAAARRAGIPAADGLGMLARQAAAQIRLFTGREVHWRRLLEAAGTGTLPG